MPKFNWEARTRTGGIQKGVIEAATVDVVEAQLKKYGFSNITIHAESKGLGFKFPKFGGSGKVTCAIARRLVMGCAGTVGTRVVRSALGQGGIEQQRPEAADCEPL